MKKLSRLSLFIIGLTLANTSYANDFCDMLKQPQKSNDAYIAMKMCNDPAQVKDFQNTLTANNKQVNILKVSNLLKLADTNEAKLNAIIQKNKEEYGVLIASGILKEIGKVKTSPDGTYVRVELQGSTDEYDLDTLTFFTPLVSSKADGSNEMVEMSTKRMKYLIDTFEGQTNIPVVIACPPNDYKKEYHNIQIEMCVVIGANEN